MSVIVPAQMMEPKHPDCAPTCKVGKSCREARSKDGIASKVGLGRKEARALRVLWYFLNLGLQNDGNDYAVDGRCFAKDDAARTATFKGAIGGVAGLEATQDMRLERTAGRTCKLT